MQNIEREREREKRESIREIDGIGFMDERIIYVCMYAQIWRERERGPEPPPRA
jgi:hypothetical protein